MKTIEKNYQRQNGQITICKDSRNANSFIGEIEIECKCGHRWSVSGEHKNNDTYYCPKCNQRFSY